MREHSCCVRFEQTSKGIGRVGFHAYVAFGLRVEEKMTGGGGGARHALRPGGQVCEIVYFFKKSVQTL